MSVKLAIVVPCYNEEEVFPATVARLLALLDGLSASGAVLADSFLLFVDDGSRDRTWALIEQHAAHERRVHGLKLSRNCGHQNALLAGLALADADVLVSIDADLQDDPDVITAMVAKYHEGCEVVYGVRDSRASDSVFKRVTARGYYRTMQLFGVEIVYDHADFRLLSKRVVTHLQDYAEVNMFLRAVIPLLGFRSGIVYYERAPRFAGISKYPLRKMLGFAITGITSFSVAPLRFITLLGFLTFLFSFAMVFWVLYGKLVHDNVIPGWASSVIPIYFLGGAQLLSIGVLGEYVAKIYLEAKRRPRYIVEKQL
jgi:polyisoprenyl-phosphate glycosyltransferase